MTREKRIGMRSVVLTGAAFLALATVLPVAAQALSDPTRPFGAEGLGAGVGGPGEDGKTAVHGFVLQSVILKPGSKPRALIDGEWLEQGQVYAGLRVLKVMAGGVILEEQKTAGAAKADKRERKFLRLTPDAEKRALAVVQTKSNIQRAIELK